MRTYVIRLLLLLPLLAVGGCWDKKELNDLAVVMGVGIDKDPRGGIYVTAQVIKPPAKQGGTAGGSALPTWSLSERGNTVMDAIHNLNEISPRRLYWSHMQIIIFNEEIAKEGIAPYMSWFSRDPESRTGTYMAVTRGKAADLLNTKIELGNVPAKTMADLIQTASLRQLPTRKMTLRDFTSYLATPGLSPTMDVIDIEYVRGKAETYVVADVALFKGDRLVGYMKKPDKMGIDMALREYRNALIKGSCPGEKDK
ncbi:Ger(x)C family spore germination protein [Paenibacillus chartarius]|uniref:Ger(X)C family spore germination protein n=1 Tax=Paenibacillus chartarius TaxID=747481 RepID=A0ABV6DFV3_9BACL